METTLIQDFVPYTFQQVANDGDILVLRFSTKADSEVMGNLRDCGQVVTLNCKATGIPNLTSAVIEWVNGCGTRRVVSSGDNYDFIVLTLTPPPIAPVTEIEVVIKISVSGNRNTFRLFGVIDGEMTLLARGVIYTNTLLYSNAIDNPEPTEDEEFIVGEIPSGLIDGMNATYTTAFAFVPESLAVFVNGVLQQEINDYTTSGQYTIMLNTSMGVGETILVDYIRG